jgi:hypothetical protein
MKNMRKIISTAVFSVIALLSWSEHCLAPITLSQKITESNVIVEGKVLSQQATWDVGQGMIYTLSTIEVTKLFKGSIIDSQVVVSTVGGQVGLDMIVAEPELELEVGDIGVFTLIPSQAVYP